MHYIDRTKVFQKSGKLFTAFTKGHLVYKTSTAIVRCILTCYIKAKRVLPPRVHTNHKKGTPMACIGNLLHADIYKAAAWLTPHSLLPGTTGFTS